MSRNFNEFDYKRIDIENYKEKFMVLLSELERAASFKEFNKMFNEIYELRNKFESMSTIAVIRHSIDTNDDFYNDENNYYDETGPIYQGLIDDFYKIIINSKFKDKIIEKHGRMIIDIAEISNKIFSEEIIEMLTEENKLVSKYSKLLASAKIEFDGKINNLSQMTPYLQSLDRDVRKNANVKMTEFFEKNEESFDLIYDKMVKIRHEISLKLGYENFTQLGYDRLGRVGYGPKEISEFRKSILKNVMPVYKDLFKRKKSRLELEQIYYYDEPLEFLSGNAVPKGDKEWMISNAEKMYSEISEESKEFFKYMTEKKLMDLEHKLGKQAGGYCTFISIYKSPFIFANFNGTSHDVDVLTHEAGHALQTYLCKDFSISEYIWPTLEAAEIYSMSMEFIAWPWMKYFFEEDEKKYKYTHLSSSIIFLNYSALVDEFQYFVYENPFANSKERKEMWKILEQKYLPYKDYDGNQFYERGGYWYRQGHIFTNPFYYIDYALAQICSFQFCFNYMEDPDLTWKNFVSMCKHGGSKNFIELIKYGNLLNPFEDKTLKDLCVKITNYLNNMNDREM